MSRCRSLVGATAVQTGRRQKPGVTANQRERPDERFRLEIAEAGADLLTHAGGLHELTVASRSHVVFEVGEPRDRISAGG